LKTVLVTGAGGSLGRLVVEQLRGRFRVRALMHRSAVAGDEVAHGDLATGAGVEAAVEGVDVVVHLAAVTHARRASRYDLVNDIGTRLLVEAAARARVERFVQVSTRAIDVRGGAYSRSKARAEAHVRRAPFDWVVVRVAEVYGIDSHEGVDALVAAARAGRPLLLVGRGGHEVCPVHGLDAAASVVAAVDSAEAVGRVYTVGGECMTVAEFADQCRAAFGSRSRVVQIPEPVVAVLSRLASVAPLPLVPDQLARLRAPKERPSSDVSRELGVHPRSVTEGLRTAATGQ
jgi:nucleoside-diphosphate-sugar epimerase